MGEVEIESREKVKSLLKELFQFDTQDLDFGIYRIMNFKRKEIEKFIEEDLIKAAEEEFREYARVGMADLQKEIEKLRAEIIRDFGEGTIDEQGNVKKHEDAPKIKEYLSKVKELGDAKLTQAQIDDVFNHVYEFFSRYYDKGDFLSKRRYGGREKYYVPHNGEEILFHWANNDQYYVKSGEYFRKYGFRAGGYLVNFVLREAEGELNDVKGEPKFFILCKDESYRLDEEKKELNIFFNWRPLTEEERKKHGTKKVQEVVVSDAVKSLFSEIGDNGPGVELRRKVDEDKTLLEKNLKNYVDKNTTDYFIHKNLKAFLEMELDFYIKNEILDLSEIESMDERRIRLNKAKIRVIRRISKKIIEFIDQIENFQKMLFEKKKFVLKTDYCITLDKVPEELYEEVGKNEKQILEWKKLFQLDTITKDTLFNTSGKNSVGADFLKAHKHLPLDTKFFSQEFKDKLLGCFSNLDDAIDGVLIKSENFQALNLLLPKYEKNVKCIYIDAPYNTGKDDFIYKDNYQDSSWLSMMADRMCQGRKMLQHDGLFFVSIDDNELQNLRTLMDNVFGTDAFVATFVWNTEGHTDNQFDVKVNHEYIVLYGFDGKHVSLGKVVDPNTPKESNLWKGFAENSITKNGPGNPASEVYLPKGFPCKVESLNLEPTEISNSFYKEIERTGYISRDITKRYQVEYPIRKDQMIATNGKLANPCRVFSGWANVNKLKQFIENGFQPIAEEDGTTTFYLSENGVIYYRKERERARHILSVLRKMGTTEQMRSELERMSLTYQYPKPKELLQHIVKVGTDGSGIVMDFFAGSGTTAQAVLNINADEGGKCKYILVEMGDCFDSVLKKRIEKLVFSREWKDGQPLMKNGISHMFKYMYLEQYEDTLNNLTFRAIDKTIQETLDSFKDYFLRFMLDYETRDSPTRLLVDKFHTPFDYKIKTISGNEEKEEPIDLVETFNYLLGLDVERLSAIKNGERTYRVVYGKRNNETIVIIWRNTKDLNLEKDKRFIEEKVLLGNTYDVIFINGDSYVKNATAIEPEFKKLIGA